MYIVYNIYILQTALPLPKREFALGDNAGPDLSALSAEKSFVYRKVSAACQPVEESSTSSNLTSSFIFNEKGSVHISFTREEVLAYNNKHIPYISQTSYKHMYVLSSSLSVRKRCCWCCGRDRMPHCSSISCPSTTSQSSLDLSDDYHEHNPLHMYVCMYL